jgi:predicted amidohydrolase YtcJ
MTAVAEPADLAVLGATVRTMDPSRPVAEAVAIRSDRIVAVGDEADVRDVCGLQTEVLRSAGGAVFPGIQDAHVHPPSAGLERLRCDLNEAADRDGYRSLIARYAAAHPDEPWILGGGWWMPAFPGGTPRAEDLDDVVPDRPVFLVNQDGHGAWVNTRALELVGIDAATADPADGRIERDPATGRPTGTLHEGAMDLVEKLIPPIGAAEWDRAILEAQRYLHAFGITAWQDAMVEREQLDAYLRLAGRGEVTARVVAALWWDRHRGVDQVEDLIEQRDLARGTGVDAGTVKIMLDGVAENFTARMLEPYLDGQGRPTGNRGLSHVEPDLLNQAVTRLDAEGFQVHFHAIGDGAVRQALDAVDAAIRANGRRDVRHHIAHLQVVHPNDVSRFGALGVTANIQALWACHEPQMDDLTIPFLGADRAACQYPFRSLLDAGAPMACGSDWSVSSPNPFLQMETAVTRVGPEVPDAESFLPEERLDLDSVLRAFTGGSAYVNRLDAETGRLSPGMAADLVVVDRDPVNAEGSLAETEVVMTMVGGKVVHDRD